MRIRLSNLGHGDAGVQQKARRPSPTNWLQPRTSIHVATSEESSHQTINMNHAARDKDMEVSRNTHNQEFHYFFAPAKEAKDRTEQGLEQRR